MPLGFFAWPMRNLGGGHFHATRYADCDLFLTGGVGDPDRGKTGSRASRIKERIIVGLDRHAGKFLQNRAGFDGFTWVDSSIIVDVVQNIIMLWVRKKDTNFIALLNGLCSC